MIDTGAPINEIADEGGVSLTAIVTAEGDGRGLADLISTYLVALRTTGAPFEMLVIHDHASVGTVNAVADLGASQPEVTLISLRPWMGEDAALKAGIDRAVGQCIVTLPGWSEIEPSEIGRMIEELKDNDMVVGCRKDAARSGLQKLRMGATHRVIGLFFGKRFNDVFFRVRVGRSDAFAKISDLGVRQHFLPVVAASEGYRVHEMQVAPASGPGVYTFKPFAHISALTDVITLYVGLKFLRRPLRFFGAVGLPIFLFGLLGTMWLIGSRLFFGDALADRPALVFSVMMLILGLQIVALGLIGEIVIFSSTRRIRSYEIGTIIRGRPEEASLTGTKQDG